MNVKMMLAGLLALPFLAACGSKDGAAQKPAPSPAVAAEATEIWANRCTTCHGEKGLGDGPGSAGLTPKPRNFSDHAWQESVTDEHIEKIIVYGGTAVGKSAAMPGNPDLGDKTAVVQALRDHVRSLKK